MQPELELTCFCGHKLSFIYDSVISSSYEQYDCHHCKITFILRPFGDKNGERIGSFGECVG